MRSGALSGIASKGIALLPPPKAYNPYEQLVRTISDLVSFWPFDSTSNLIDVIGDHNGTFNGSGQTIVESLAANSDGKAVNFPGTAGATVIHRPAFILPEFSLSLWFKQHIFPAEEIGSVMPVVVKDLSSNTLGDFSIFVDTDGGVIVRMQDGTTSFTIGGPIAPLLNNHLSVSGDATGFWAYLNAQYVGKSDAVKVGWGNNVADLFFAHAPFLAYQFGNCVLDAVALYGRALTENEHLALSQRTQPPIAVGGIASVPEQATTVIDVTANDVWVGKKADLVVAIRSNPGSPDSVNVNADKDINYVAGNISADAQKTFSYDITDPLGKSNIAQVNVTVRSSDVPEPPPTSGQANCYTENTNDVRRVTTMADLQTQVNSAPPGRTILIAGGTYSGGSITFNRQGSDTNPIVIRAENGLGTVTINDANWSLATTSARLVFSKLYFNRSNINVNGAHNRITRNRFREIDTKAISVFAATDTRIDHNDFSGYVAEAVVRKHCIQLNGGAIQSGTLRRVLIDYNFIHDFPPPDVPLSQATDCAFITNDHNGPWNIDCGRIEDHNLYLNAHARTGEFINVKHSNAKVRYCTFINTYSYLQQRDGGGWEIRSCWFENMGTAAPLKCADCWASNAGPSLIIGNRLVNQDIWIMAGGTNPNGPDGHSTNPTPSNRAREAQVIGNIARTIMMGGWWSSSAPVYPAFNCNYFGNTATRLDQLAVGTTTSNPATTTFANVPRNPSVTPWYDYTPAVKIPTPTLSPSDQVGMFAPDPLCPSGPQS